MSWTHLRDEVPKARKPYRCGVCNSLIGVGEKHVARTGVGDDGPETFRMHCECEEYSCEWKEDEWESHYPGDVSRAEVLAALSTPPAALESEDKGEM